MLSDGIAICTTWYNLFRGRQAGVLGTITLSNILLVNGEIVSYMIETPHMTITCACIFVGTIYFMYALRD